MAHKIYIDEGRASMMYSGVKPWHRLGTRLDGPATAAEAIDAANLNWRVAKLPLYATTGVIGIPLKGKYAVVREDKITDPDTQPFAIVGESYTPLQNSEAFEFFDHIVRDQNAAIYHTAGALDKGGRVWILAKLPGEIRVVGDDITQKYLLLANSHDAKSAVQVKFTPIRVVCDNTLTAALADGSTISVPHHKNVNERLKHSQALLGVVDNRFEQLELEYKKLAAVAMNTRDIQSYLKAVFPDPLKPELIKQTAQAKQNRTFAEHLFAEGIGNRMPGVAGTLWAAYNGVTELIDHRVHSFDGRTVVTGDNSRLSSVWFGAGATTKLRAYSAALDIVSRN